MSGRIENLKKSFGAKVLFDGLSHRFSKGRIYALIGNSGTGKTTLLRMISGLDTSYDGEIDGFGTVSYSFQEYRLFENLNALQNVYELAFPKKTERALEESRKALLSLGFSEDELTLLPRELSGGMKQRVSLCRSLLYSADTYLFDEPFKELDSTLIGILKQELLSLASEHTVILSVHSQDECMGLPAEFIKIGE